MRATSSSTSPIKCATRRSTCDESDGCRRNRQDSHPTQLSGFPLAATYRLTTRALVSCAAEEQRPRLNEPWIILATAYALVTIERLPGPDDDEAADTDATEDYALIDFDEGL